MAVIGVYDTNTWMNHFCARASLYVLGGAISVMGCGVGESAQISVGSEPRMTVYADPDSINATVPSVSYSVGDTGPAGGIVFYASDTPFICGVNLTKTCTYLESSPSSNPDVLRVWSTNANSNQSSTVSGARADAIGAGLRNTVSITAQTGNVSAFSAAVYASEYNQGGFSDWFLPSKDELNALYTSRASVGGFTNYYYWSSSEAIETHGSGAWYQHFDTGVQGYNSKHYTVFIRCVRAF